MYREARIIFTKFNFIVWHIELLKYHLNTRKYGKVDVLICQLERYRTVKHELWRHHNTTIIERKPILIFPERDGMQNFISSYRPYFLTDVDIFYVISFIKFTKLSSFKEKLCFINIRYCSCLAKNYRHGCALSYVRPLSSPNSSHIQKKT